MMTRIKLESVSVSESPGVLSFALKMPLKKWDEAIFASAVALGRPSIRRGIDAGLKICVVLTYIRKSALKAPPADQLKNLLAGTRRGLVKAVPELSADDIEWRYQQTLGIEQAVKLQIEGRAE